MNLKQIAVLSLAMFLVLSVCATAEEVTKPEKQDAKATSSSAEETAKAEVKNAPKADQASLPEKETVVEESAVTVDPTPVYSNRAHRGYGYSRQQIRSMPMVARPDRPGHFFGNTVRAIHRARRGW